MIRHGDEKSEKTSQGDVSLIVSVAGDALLLGVLRLHNAGGAGGEVGENWASSAMGTRITTATTTTTTMGKGGRPR